jgi:hypothetical protein
MNTAARKILSVSAKELESLEGIQLTKVHKHLETLLSSLNTSMAEAKCNSMCTDLFDTWKLAFPKLKAELRERVRMEQYISEPNNDEPGKPGTVDFDASFILYSHLVPDENDDDELTGDLPMCLVRFVHMIDPGEEEKDDPQTTLYIELEGNALVGSASIWEDVRSLDSVQLFGAMLAYCLFEMEKLPPIDKIKVQAIDEPATRSETEFFRQNSTAIVQEAERVIAFTAQFDQEGDEDDDDGEDIESSEEDEKPLKKKSRK